MMVTIGWNKGGNEELFNENRALVLQDLKTKVLEMNGGHDLYHNINVLNTIELYN